MLIRKQNGFVKHHLKLQFPGTVNSLKLTASSSLVLMVGGGSAPACKFFLCWKRVEAAPRVPSLGIRTYLVSSDKLQCH